jgi:tungstate transport system substrate-binding protein
MKSPLLAGMVALAVIAAAVGAAIVLWIMSEPQTLVLATTTSTYDSGLLGYILPEFEEEYDCEVDVIAVGSGQAMELGKNGDADVLLVHSPASEKALVAEGYGESRTLVMYNNFVIVGPEDDPAGTAASEDATDAFVRIHDNGTAGLARFVSRGDSSGTHAKEKSIWAAAGLNISTFSADWYNSAGSGMGDVLDMCEEMNAYTLSDDATYYQRVDVGIIPHMAITYSGDPMLFNQYSVIPVNATMHPHINHALVMAFKDWITSQEGQELIASYEKFGHQLFFPNAEGYVAGTHSAPMIASDQIEMASACETSNPRTRSGAALREPLRASDD